MLLPLDFAFFAAALFHFQRLPIAATAPFFFSAALMLSHAFRRVTAAPDACAISKMPLPARHTCRRRSPCLMISSTGFFASDADACAVYFRLLFFTPFDDCHFDVDYRCLPAVFAIFAAARLPPAADVLMRRVFLLFHFFRQLPMAAPLMPLAADATLRRLPRLPRL